MSHVDPDTAPMPPIFSPITRTRIYVAVFVGGIVTFGAVALAPVWLDPETAARVSDTATILGTLLAMLGGGVGYNYRPTRY